LPLPFRQGHLRKFVSDASIYREIASDTPLVVHISVDCVLVAVISCSSQRTLSQEVGHLICEVPIKRQVVIVTALPLSETLRGDVFTILATKFEAVLTLTQLTLSTAWYVFWTANCGAFGSGPN